ncbi:unnamed protein product [Linum tenue]|uniref:Cytochrome P450 n=1 Tax=Linum tenue TaxID=586396 RepID=A0AAV0L290_9ROSI|nr:unnamed protein product [Linum tenue]
MHCFCSRVIIYGGTKNGEIPRRRRYAPESSSALPIIGHLHMLTMGSKPAVAPALAAMADKYGPVLTVWLGMQRILVVSYPKVVKE